MHGDSKFRPELFGKRLRLGSLRALVAGHIQRIADDSLRHSMLTKHTRHRFHVGLPTRPMQREQWLRRITKRVRDGQPDAPVPHVEGNDSRNKLALLFLQLCCLLA